MPNITIDESGCRACSLCVEICPVDVLAMDDARELARVQRQDDCIGCTSCVYLCPSRCIEVTDIPLQRPFYRIEQNAALVEKFLQRTPARAQLEERDYDEALKDVNVRLQALADAANETMGRGQKAAGRKAGQLAASHLPELYEGRDMEEVVAALKARFHHAFAFSSSVEGGGEGISVDFDHCALQAVVESQGEKIGEARLCVLFHEYWAGLLGEFSQKKYMVEPGNGCSFRLQSR